MKFTAARNEPGSVSRRLTDESVAGPSVRWLAHCLSWATEDFGNRSVPTLTESAARVRSSNLSAVRVVERVAFVS
jgi:hypothetical protein